MLFVSVQDVLAIHVDTIQHEGGLPGLRDPGLLEAAVLMPQQKLRGQCLHPGLAEMAAAYLFHLFRNHAFNDGNQRVAVLAALIFLKVNGVERLPEPDDLEAVALEVASGERGKEELTKWLHEEVGDFPVSS